jgi:aminoglycoside phosphotransferase (APT) family kinase protein
MAHSTSPSAIPTIDADLVKRLVSSQFAHWSRLSVRAVEPGGWDNRTFRLGADKLVRLPTAAQYAAQVEKEQRWLPKLRGRLPLAIPQPLAMGQPGCGYPWRWSVYRWIEGATAANGRIDTLSGFAADLAAFLAALHRVDPGGGPVAGSHNFYRGAPLAHYDAETHRAIATADDAIDQAHATSVWTAALESVWSGPPVWVHGDVAPSNLLVRDGRLAAVIDFGCLGVGDPACDLVIAWTFLDASSREVFRDALGFDTATWARARGWALWKAAITLVNAEDPGNDRSAAEARRVIQEIVSDHADPRAG